MAAKEDSPFQTVADLQGKRLDTEADAIVDVSETGSSPLANGLEVTYVALESMPLSTVDFNISRD